MSIRTINAKNSFLLICFPLFVNLVLPRLATFTYCKPCGQQVAHSTHCYEINEIIIPAQKNKQ